MNRIDQRFAQLKSQRRPALIPFVTAGDPNPAWTVDILHALVQAGADLIELGVPFSDPMADGLVIQQASERALRKGMRLERVIALVRSFRLTDATTPVVLMGYLNPIEMRGTERFAQEASAAGVDGLLLVDLPPEEAHDARTTFNQHGLALVLLAAPTTSAERLARIAREAQGYLYYVSFAGVTGADSLRPSEVAERVASLRQMASVPVVVGFGVKDAASAAALAPLADGVVVGSALVSALDKAGGAGAATAATAFLAPLRAALDA